MIRDIDMKVLPSFKEEECQITFSFRFSKEKTNIGEAIIHTAMGDLFKKSNTLHTVAYCEQFSIVEEYRNISLKKLMDFLKVIGIQRFSFTSNGKVEEKII
ncbi:MAG TPA: hypothetical protein VEV44_17855 [Pseudoneobacillus sp.]|jgi:hypothetical protein|nr:hypothetical protein [Pseudoneobacillus sp.]